MARGGAAGPAPVATVAVHPSAVLRAGEERELAFAALVEDLAERAKDGAHPELVEPVLPAEGASFVIKACHSTFYETPLEYLLDQMEVDRLVPRRRWS